MVKITYDSVVKSYTVEVKTARQYLGDVTGYQAQVEALSNTLAAREQQVEELLASSTAAAEAELRAAYTEGVEHNG